MKLNKTNREEIINAAIRETFKLALADLENARTTLADAVYEHAFGEYEKLARKLPKGWLEETSRITIKCSGFSWRGGYENAGRPEEASNEMKMSKPRLMPRNVNDAFTVANDHLALEQAQTVATMHVKLYDAKKALREKLTALVYSVTSTEKLREAWPEGARFLPDDAIKPNRLPVSVNLTREVNAMMGLVK